MLKTQNAEQGQMQIHKSVVYSIFDLTSRNRTFGASAGSTRVIDHRLTRTKLSPPSCIAFSTNVIRRGWLNIALASDASDVFHLMDFRVRSHFPSRSCSWSVVIHITPIHCRRGHENNNFTLMILMKIILLNVMRDLWVYLVHSVVTMGIQSSATAVETRRAQCAGYL